MQLVNCDWDLESDAIVMNGSCTWCSCFEWLRFRVAKCNFKSQPLNEKMRRNKNAKIKSKNSKKLL